MILFVAVYASAASKQGADTKPKIALLGDSMTWIGGDSCQNETGWSHILKVSGLASEIDVYARSGATWTNTKNTNRNPGHYTELLHDDNVVYNQAIRLIERADTSDVAPDIIIIFAGANDAWFNAKRPGIFDIDSSQFQNITSRQPSDYISLQSSIGLVCELLHSRFPDTTLLFIAPLQMSKTDAETIHKVSDFIENTVIQRGWKTLRADREIDITHEQEAKSPKFTYDGVHTNPAGAKILGDYIIKNLYPYIHSQKANN